MTLRALLPAGTSADDVLARLRPATVPEDRPFVIANFVTTPDGSVTIDGESGTIGDHAPSDRRIFRALRDAADAVLAGTGTLAAERYNRLIPTEERRAARVSAGLAADALAVVLSRSGDIPSGVPMLEDPAQPVATFLGDDADPATAFAALRRQHDIEVLLCEGGPELLGDLVRRGLVDELYLTIAPVLLTGEPERTLLSGDAAAPRPLELRALLEDGGGLHARYAMLAPQPADPPGTPAAG